MNIIKKIFLRVKKGDSIRIYTALVLSQSLIFCMFVFFAGGITLMLTVRMITENSRYYANMLLMETKQRIGIAMNEIETVSLNLARNKEVISYVHDQNLEIDQSARKNYEWFTKLSGLVDNIGTYEKGIHSIGVFSMGTWLYFGAINDKNIYSTEYLNPQYDILYSNDLRLTWLPMFELNYGQYQLISLQRMIIDTQKFMEVGVITINVKVQYFNQILASSQIEQNGDICIIDVNGNIVAWSNPNIQSDEIKYQLSKHVATKASDTIIKTIDAKQYLICFDTIKGCNWKVVGVFPLDQIKGGMRRNQLIIILSGIVGLLIALFTSAVIASKITAPINKLIDAMNIIQSGDLSVRAIDNSFFETEKLGYGFNKMLEDINQLIVKVYEEQIRERDAKIEAYQAQISPHFLYNTLETINALLIIDDNYKVSNLVTMLSDVFKYSVSGDDKMLTLKDDMHYVQKYLSIQKVRFGENLNYMVDIHPDVEKAFIMKLIIQPIVENAVMHGIEAKIGKSYILINAYTENNKLIISVSDNGKGMQKEKLDQLMSVETVLGKKGEHARIGINNVLNRIKLSYGPEYGLKIESTLGKGTKVEIILPLIIGEETNDKNNDC